MITKIFITKKFSWQSGQAMNSSVYVVAKASFTVFYQAIGWHTCSVRVGVHTVASRNYETKWCIHCKTMDLHVNTVFFIVHLTSVGSMPHVIIWNNGWKTLCVPVVFVYILCGVVSILDCISFAIKSEPFHSQWWSLPDPWALLVKIHANPFLAYSELSNSYQLDWQTCRTQIIIITLRTPKIHNTLLYMRYWL